GLLDRHVAADLALGEAAVRIARVLAGEEDEIADLPVGHVICRGLRRRRQGEAHSLQFVFGAHASILLNLFPSLACHHFPASPQYASWHIPGRGESKQTAGRRAMIELFRSTRSLQLLALNYGSVRPHQGSAARMQTLASCLTIPMKQVGNWVGERMGRKIQRAIGTKSCSG